MIAEKSGLSRAWIGLVLIACITSLPELMTGVSSVAVVGALDIAYGDIMGSCVFNLFILALMDPMHGARPIFLHAGKGHLLSSAFSVVLIAIAVVSILAAPIIPSVAHISLVTPVIIVVYFIGMRTLFLYEKHIIDDYVTDAAKKIQYAEITLSRAVVFFSLNALVVVGAAFFLPFIAEEIAVSTGLGRTFVGSVFVALSTSLPEIVISISAIRLGALDMAVANMFGSNMFNILVLAIDDIVYTSGTLYSAVSVNHSITGIVAIIMSSIAMISLVFPPMKSTLMRCNWGTLSMLVLGILNFVILFLMTHHGGGAP